MFEIINNNMNIISKNLITSAILKLIYKDYEIFFNLFVLFSFVILSIESA